MVKRLMEQHFWMNKKGIALLGIILIAILGSVALISLGIVSKPAFIGGQIVWQANWGTMECKPSPSKETYSKYLAQQQLFICKEYTEECYFIIENTKQEWYAISANGKYRECDINGENCGGWVTYRLEQAEKQTLTRLLRGRSYEFSLGIGTTGEEHTRITKEYNQWKLWSEEFGRDFVSGSEGCKFPWNLKDQIEDNPTCFEQGGLTFDDSCRVINYVTHWVEAEGNVYSYNGRDVVCQARTLYEVDRRQFADGSYRYFQGNIIKSVECCPFEPICQDDFTILPEPPVPEEKECDYDYQCLNGGEYLPVDSTHIKRQRCIGGRCEYEALKTVECTTSAECIRKYGEGYVCSTNYECLLSQTPNYCGDGHCDSLEGESLENCEEDCSCPDGETLVTRIGKVNCLVPLVKWGCDEIIEKKCEKVKPDFLYYLMWIIIILIAIGVIYYVGFPLIKILAGKLGIPV